ncbi:MAG TPA: alanine racemase, partial [Trueperaceae bacterium]|nr:alanine racemase [Trueperaceae bacterium]
MARAYINLSTLNHNLSIIKTKLKPQTKILAAVKANAYGHGAVPIARYLADKVDYLAVATKSEALELARAGIKKDILIFAPVYTDLEELIEENISLTVVDAYSLELIEKAVKNKKAKVHLKIDTGMGRIGQDWQGSIKLAQKIANSDKLEFTGAWTHFASSDAENRAYTEYQLDNFNKFLSAIKELAIRPKIIHAANSAAIFAYPE